MSIRKNVDPTVNDIFYRYKRDQIDIVNSNKNNGTSTLTNLDLISKQLCAKITSRENRTTISNTITHAILKRIKRKLGVSITTQNDQFVINGNILSESIEEIINDFVVKYILCPKCRLPEWGEGCCSACGFTNIEPHHIPITSVEIDDSIEDVISIRLHQLYDKRDQIKSTDVDLLKNINHELDVIWDNLI